MSFLVPAIFGFMSFLYNPDDTITINGKVDSVFVIKDRSVQICVHLTSGKRKRKYNVILGPPWFLDMVPSVGDSLKIEGARASNRQGFIIARKVFNITRGYHLKLRTHEGFPLWHRPRRRNFRWNSGCRGRRKWAGEGSYQGPGSHHHGMGH